MFFKKLWIDKSWNARAYTEDSNLLR